MHTNALREMMERVDIEAAMASKRSRDVPLPQDTQAGELMKRIDNFFKKLKYFQCIATR